MKEKNIFYTIYCKGPRNHVDHTTHLFDDLEKAMKCVEYANKTDYIGWRYEVRITINPTKLDLNNINKLFFGYDDIY